MDPGDPSDPGPHGWQAWLARLAVAVLCSAGIASGADTPAGSGTGAHPNTVETTPASSSGTETEPGTWQRHRVHFNCIRCGVSHDLLRLQMSNLLEQSGARLNAPVVFAGYGGLDYADLDYSTLQRVDNAGESDANRSIGRWQPVRFELNLGTMDQTRNPPCVLLYYFKLQVLSTFDTRRLSADLPCESFVRTPSYHLAFEVFAPVS